MEQLAATWGRLTAGKKATAVLAVLASIAAIWFLAQSASKPSMALLYAGLDPGAAGEVLSALETMDVVAEVRGDAIYVPEAKRDSVRMSLAREGLPSQGQVGFELLDQLDGFATTSEMFDAAYWRAKEGELARTILASPNVKSARVHIAAPKGSAFSRNAPAPSAVVTVAMARGRLDGAQAVAMRYLVALAVPRLDPEQVAVIDSAVGVILKPGVEDPAADLAGAGEAREKALERNLVSLLEARVGVGNARVAVSLDIDRERETVNERIIDPESRTLVSRENSDTTESDVGSASGAVTVASNLPEGDAAAPASQSKSQRSEASETTTFDLSETRREREKIAGAVKRATIAVLINSAPGVPDPEAAEDAPTPPRTARAPEELEALKKLVMAAAGFDAARGDVVTIESLDFDEPASAGAEAAKAGLVDWLMTHLMQVLQLLIPAIVALVLALFVVKPLLTSKEAPVLTPIPPTQLATAPTPLEPPRQATPIEDARRAASEKKDASAAVLKSWLDDAGTAA